jgi:NTP pyrophosphatase (non-canonical NTP hydrolase)|tara:strand:+ start:3819 stop:4616 length:798 start_codon:yes stop_codon:yes gene_type:complete
MTPLKQSFPSDKKTYYIYHIPGQKIGMTCNLNKRVEIEQGYNKDEYDVLFSSRDVDKTSWMERQLQKFYGYKIDRQLYTNLIKLKSMKVNPTEQTTTFDCEKQDIQMVLDQNDGYKWQTSLGEFEINNETKKWIVANIKPSMYNNDRCFIYNKAFYEAFLAKPAYDKAEIFNLIRSWADERGIYKEGDPKTQLIKLYEETGELAKALLEGDKNGIIDAIGDSVVVLTNLSKLVGYDIESCVQSAYDEISSRTGRMIDGTFVKDTL